MNIGCVLMAAGTASRFGANKLLHKVDGQSMIARVLDAAPAHLFARAVAVVSDAQVEHIAVEAGYQPIWNPDPARGQGTTIALGAATMDDMDAVMFCVGDQPYLTRDSVRRLISGHDLGSITSLSFQGKRGNPVVFPDFCMPELAALKPEQTGRAVIARHLECIQLVEAQNGRELHDIDTPHDLNA